MTEKDFKQIFPLGEKNDAYAQYFVGQSYLSMLTTERVGIANVTFEPGCRKLAYSSQRRTDFAMYCWTWILSGVGKKGSGDETR